MPIQTDYRVRFFVISGSAFCASPVSVRTSENSLPPSWRSLLYIFAFALFSTCVTGRWLLEFDMIDFPLSTLRKRPRNEHDEVVAIVGNQRHNRK